MLRVRGEAGVGDLLDLRMLLEEARQRSRVLGVPLHPDVQRLQAAQDEEAVERARHAAHRVLQELEPLEEDVIARHHRAAHHVGVAVQVLGGGVGHDVDPVLERALKEGAREGIVDHRPRAVRPGHLRGGGQVHDLEHGVGRALDPDELRVLAEPPLDGARLAHVDVAELQPVPPVDLVEDAEGAAVDVVGGEDVVPRLEQVEERVGGGQPRGEGERVRRPLQRRQAALQRVAGGVVRPRVLVTLVLARAGLHVRRGQVDRRHDGAGGGVRPLPGVDGEGLEGELAVVGHGHLSAERTSAASARGSR